MSDSIHFNVDNKQNPEDVDRLNNSFYSRFNYPWVPLFLPSYEDPDFWTASLNHDLGYWDRPRIKPDMKIWVGGCGTNQAILTALKFPQAQVLGSDVSTESLNTCARVAEQIGLTNLTLREESLNATSYDQEFDYVICTGVIHHNADPSIPLKNLMRGLKADGIMELMVYNYYHRIHTTAFQKAIRLLGGLGGQPNVEKELPLTMDLVQNFPTDCLMKDFLDLQRSLPEAAVADSLLQPVEYSYTVQSLDALAQDCNLTLLSYCLNQFDKLSGNSNWLMDFAGEEQKFNYAKLDEIDQWQTTNLLLGEKSPMLWFYLQKSDCPIPALTEKAICAKFLNTAFHPASTTTKNHVLKEAGFYELSPQAIPCPAPRAPINPTAALVFSHCDGTKTIRQILQENALSAEPHFIQNLRLSLCSSGHPYLKAVQS
ncbi:class I SAM-dependent methyltransferase [Kiloniella laminariae]|uniref:class I SAM-dependent methyltransferase n=1 Tax=Kiloniella laminariae TaxID=454162 RepID=UPI0003635F07|nr:class I SAM-dependent methyltransferase [Kiloniella laminariae]